MLIHQLINLSSTTLLDCSFLPVIILSAIHYNNSSVVTGTRKVFLHEILWLLCTEATCIKIYIFCILSFWKRWLTQMQSKVNDRNFNLFSCRCSHCSVDSVTLSLCLIHSHYSRESSLEIQWGKNTHIHPLPPPLSNLIFLGQDVQSLVNSYPGLTANWAHKLSMVANPGFTLAP